MAAAPPDGEKRHSRLAAASGKEKLKIILQCRSSIGAKLLFSMSSDEDFSLVTDIPQPSEDTLEGVQILIANYKKKHEQLIEDQKELASGRDDLHELAQQFRKRTDKLSQSLEADRCSYMVRLENEKAQLNSLMLEEAKLTNEIQRVEAALKEEEAKHRLLKQETDVFTAVPERTVFFKGATGKPGSEQLFDMETHIVYPMEGGTALITFEEEVVAKKILEKKLHQVDLGAECSITVEARPVQLMVPKVLKIDSEVCPQRILISNLPKMDSEILLNKLEIHFSKTRNGGAEVEECEMLHDSWTVVIKFLQPGIAKGLTDTEYHEVMLQQKAHRVRVTPFINGNITNLQTEMSVCPRTVMLTGIPAVMEQENLQDLLEIHFQKSVNGGGEVEAFLYSPVGQQTMALFEGDSKNELK